ncbi:hypothetical protein C5974_20815 [Cronobacter sakazakii]|nr:hypothetical protein C5974_20815 [Cronobacter sakazakii]
MAGALRLPALGVTSLLPGGCFVLTAGALRLPALRVTSRLPGGCLVLMAGALRLPALQMESLLQCRVGKRSAPTAPTAPTAPKRTIRHLTNPQHSGATMRFRYHNGFRQAFSRLSG